MTRSIRNVDMEEDRKASTRRRMKKHLGKEEYCGIFVLEERRNGY